MPESPVADGVTVDAGARVVVTGRS